MIVHSRNSAVVCPLVSLFSSTPFGYGHFTGSPTHITLFALLVPFLFLGFLHFQVHSEISEQQGQCLYWGTQKL